MKQITTYIESGRTFGIFEETGEGATHGFWGIEDKLFGEDGKLLQPVNGVQGHHFPTLQETIEHVSTQIKYDALIASGMSEIDAIKTLFLPKAVQA